MSENKDNNIINNNDNNNNKDNNINENNNKDKINNKKNLENNNNNNLNLNNKNLINNNNNIPPFKNNNNYNICDSITQTENINNTLNINNNNHNNNNNPTKTNNNNNNNINLNNNNNNENNNNNLSNNKENNNNNKLINNIENNNKQSNKKKDWKSWSSQEKLLFYKIIANGGNYTSLQKLFKTMNDKIGTKSTKKIRDFYYRMLKNVNILLKHAGENRLNSRNRDEVILGLTCYGKIWKYSNQKKVGLDMKKLNKHPRLFKKIANTLKKLITNKIKSIRSKMINNYNNNNNNLNNNINNNNKNFINNINYNNNNKINNNNKYNSNIFFTNEFSLNLPTFRKIPYEKFFIRIFPYDKETYLKMIEFNYNSRIEINISNNKSLKYIIKFLEEKWISLKKLNYKLFLIPIRNIWIPHELPYFYYTDEGKA